MSVPTSIATDRAIPTGAASRSGGRVFWWAWGGLAGITAAVDLVNILTRLHDGRADHVFEPLWRPVAYEFSSGLVATLLFPVIWRLAQAAKPGDGRPLRAVGLHLGAALGFAVAHVGGFVLLRKAVFALAGQTYDFGGLAPFFYELPKDLVSYIVAVGLIWGVERMLVGLPRPAAVNPDEGSTFDIRDGAKVVRVRIEDILAVRSAGNYVEFLLADGRAPLMRATLAAVEARLAPHGVARTHRSWLVNTGRIEEIEPARSGDYRLSLKGGIEAPLSRRFRPALKA